jgi:uncharacterized protein YbcI
MESSQERPSAGGPPVARDPARAEPGAAGSQISRSIVKLHAQHYGRGPTKAKTYLNAEYALCVLEEVFTPAEHTLIEHGNAEQVTATRAAFQDAISDRFIGVVEEVTGRDVRAFVSHIHIGQNLAIELFLFEDPAPDADPGTDE